MTNKPLIVIWAASVILAAALSGFVVYHYINKPITQPIAQPVISKPITRPPDITCEQALGHLRRYDTDAFVINWKELSQTSNRIDVNITGNLYQRNFSQDAAFPIAESGNFKFYLGLGMGTVATVGAIYGGYKLVQLLK